MIKHAEHVIKYCWGLDSTDINDNAFIQRYADNLKLCSCSTCGNPRRISGKKTRQELIHEDYY